MNGFSVIMPTYNQSTYIRRAIQSLLSQTYDQWELIIIDDGCSDDTELYIQDYLSYSCIKYIKNKENNGLGFALNQGLNEAKYDFIAYLPSDDFYYPNHLEVMKKAFEELEDRVLVYAASNSKRADSIQRSERETTRGLFDMYSLQLVQTAHKKTADRWTTRVELLSDDLFLLFWCKLTTKGIFYYVNEITSYWSVHAFQQHVILNERHGGNLNYYRQYYKVRSPLKVKISDHKFIDENELYKDYRKKTVYASNKLKILLVGELSYHPERIYALEEEGHQLYGLWIDHPPFFLSNVGHLPFGQVEDLTLDNWEYEIQKIKPDLIYGLLNYSSISLAYEVLKKNLDIPFLWHFKEGPFLAQSNGLWEKLIELYRLADGKIYINPETEAWYNIYMPKSMGLTYILDGDLPKKNCFNADFSPRLSDKDGEIHTVIPGRNIGLGLDDIEFMGENGVHLHIYESTSMQKMLTEKAMKIAPKYVHYHPYCSQENWVKEFSQYDTGWLHCFDSHNHGQLNLATWDDLNMPARMSVLAAAGLPMIQKNNDGHIVATQNHLKKMGCGIFFKDYEDLINQLHDVNQMERLRRNVITNRFSFCFDYHVKDLVNFFYKVIAYKQSIIQ